MEPVVKRWQPHVDLRRLCEAAQEDILAASDEEVRQASLTCGRSVARTAAEIRSMIADVTGEPDEPEGPLSPADTAKRDVHWARQH
jgi:hypothetical protein